MKRYLLPAMLLTVLAAAGCYSEEPGVAYSASYGYAGPDMEVVAPGVQVIADYDYPVFFSDGFYWRYDAGYWYRSPYYDRGWIGVREVPYGLRGVRDPWIYSHYRAGATWNGSRWEGGRAVSYGRGPVVRDHRGYEPAYRASPGYRSAPAYRSAPVYRSAPARGPVIRDHRR
jgi:hypothetical protein